MKNIITKPILITGSTGFIGSNLLRYFVNNKINTNIIIRKKSKIWRIKDILNNQFVSIYYCDLNDKKKLSKIIDKIKPKSIFHLATYGAYAFQSDEDKIKKNILDTSINLFQSCNKYNFKIFINTGSNSEYGFKTKKMSENDILEPNSFYAVYKAAVSQYFRYISISKKLPIVTVRPFHVYGPYEEPSRLIPNLIINLLNNKMIDLVSPKISRDMIYIDECINLYLKIASFKNEYGAIYNIGSGVRTQIKYIVEKAQKYTNTQKTLKPKWNSMQKRKWDQEIWLSDMSIVKKKLRWKNKINLDEGIKLTTLWLKKNKKLYK